MCLVVCGFAFDPHVSEEAKNYGKLTVLATRMNPDLAMGEELLKKTGVLRGLTLQTEDCRLEIKRIDDWGLSIGKELRRQPDPQSTLDSRQSVNLQSAVFSLQSDARLKTAPASLL